MKTIVLSLFRFLLLLFLSCPNTHKVDSETKLETIWCVPTNLVDSPKTELLIIDNKKLVYSGEEDLVAISVNDGTEIWRGDIEGWRALYNRQEMLFEPNREWIISTHYENVMVWNATNGEKLYELSNSTHGISASRIGHNTLMPDGYLIIGYPTDLYILNWNGSVRDSIIIPVASTSVAFNDLSFYLGQTKTINGGLTQGRIRAFDATTGDSLWTYQTDNGGFHTRLYVQDGVVYGGTKGNSPYSEVVALNAESGDVVWKYVSENAGEWTNNFSVNQETILIKGTSSSFALNKHSGKKKWNFGWENSSSIGLMYLEGFVYMTDSYHLYVLEEHTGELVHTEIVPKENGYYWHIAASKDKIFAQTSASIIAYEPWHLRGE
jgi:hypothetical protein